MMCENSFPMCFFRGGDLKIHLSWSLKGCEHRDDTPIVDLQLYLYAVWHGKSLSALYFLCFLKP